jgi:hypothetical protein
VPRPFICNPIWRSGAIRGALFLWGLKDSNEKSAYPVDNKEIMGQHYIPQHYLRSFCAPLSSSEIWVYEKGNERIFNTNVWTAANENHRWPKEIEEYLEKKIETPANRVLDKIQNRQILTNAEKDVLSAYIITMMERVPEGLKRTKEIFPKVREEVFEGLEKSILKLIEENPSKKEILQQRLKELPYYKTKYENEFPQEIWYRSISANTFPRTRLVLPTMTWRFLTSDKKQPFLTNDNPVFYFKSLGIARPNSEITFPISSEIALWATWDNVKECFLLAKEPIVQEINRRTASNTTRFAYYSMEANWVTNLINKKHWKFHRIT